jgi:hypothetical protein
MLRTSGFSLLSDTNSYGAQSCPTSNCTWPVYDTFGVCSRCEDVSTYLSYACLNSTIDWTAGLNGGYNARKQYTNNTTCGYFLNATSTNPILMSGYIVNDGLPEETLLVRILPLTTIFDYEPLYGNGSIMFKEFRNTIADILIVSAANGSVAGVRQGQIPVAQECILSWCVKTLRSSYDSGQYSEELLHTFHNTTRGPFPWISTPFQTNDQNGTDNSYIEDIHVDLDTTQERQNITGYGTTNDTASSNIQGFQDIFPSFSTSIDGNSSPKMRWKTWQKGSAWLLDLDHNPWMAPNNVTQHMERLAIAMTNVVRSAPSRIMLEGNAYTKETFISVQWAWLAFPFILLVFSLVFLVSTMVKTSKDGASGVWKTSAMPTLIYGLPLEVQKDVSLSQKDIFAPEKGAKQVRIKLHPEHGWRVSEQLHIAPAYPRRDEGRNMQPARADWL